MKEKPLTQEKCVLINDVFIYGLIDPFSKEIRYIGKTVNPNYRFSQHIKYEIKTDTHKSRWIKSLLKQGAMPIIIILEKTNSLEWESRERYWIKKLKFERIALTNETDGGDGRSKGFKHKPESVQKIIAALKERSPKIRRIAALKTSLKLKNKPLPLKQRKKLSESHKKFWKTLSQDSKMVFLRHLKHGWSQELRAKVSQSLRGRKSSASTSKYLGVSWFKRDSKWRAWLRYNGKQIHLGYFNDEVEAAAAYNAAAIKYYGEFAYLNPL